LDVGPHRLTKTYKLFQSKAPSVLKKCITWCGRILTFLVCCKIR